MFTSCCAGISCAKSLAAGIYKAPRRMSLTPRIFVFPLPPILPSQPSRHALCTFCIAVAYDSCINSSSLTPTTIPHRRAKWTSSRLSTSSCQQRHKTRRIPLHQPPLHLYPYHHRCLSISNTIPLGVDTSTVSLHERSPPSLDLTEVCSQSLY